MGILRGENVPVAALFAAVVLVAACSSSTGDQPGDDVTAAESEPGAAVDEDLELNAWNPDKPVYLGGADGVTPEQQAAAETILTDTLEKLPRFEDPADAEAAGYSSIGDAATGYEHYVNWDYRFDETDLDANRPESLVYRVDDANGGRTLVAAMYMLAPGSVWDDIPDELVSPIVQWHIHQDLCYSDDPVAPTVVGTVEAGEDCPDDQKQFEPVPMVHVWIVPHECGPFAALEGGAGGQVPEGEHHLCDTIHGERS